MTTSRTYLNELDTTEDLSLAAEIAEAFRLARLGCHQTQAERAAAVAGVEARAMAQPIDVTAVFAAVEVE